MFTWLVLMVVHIGQLVVSVETVFGLTDWPLYKCGQWWVFRQCLDWLADLCTYVASGECSDSVWIDWPLYKCGQRVCSDRMRVWSHSLKSSTLAYSQCSDDFTNKNLCVLTLLSSPLTYNQASDDFANKNLCADTLSCGVPSPEAGLSYQASLSVCWGVCSVITLQWKVKGSQSCSVLLGLELASVYWRLAMNST